MTKTFRTAIRSVRSANLKSKIQNPKWVGIVALGVTFAMCGAAAQAQQAKKIPRIGYLSASSASEALLRTKAFRQGLHELGYVEGKNLILDLRFAEGKFDRLPALATELVHPKLS